MWDVKIIFDLIANEINHKSVNSRPNMLQTLALGVKLRHWKIQIIIF